MQNVNLPGSYLVLELTNFCPLKCGHCAVADASLGHPHYAQTTHLDLGLVRELLRDLERNGIFFDNLVMFWLGEPTSNPDFAAIYEEVLRRNHSGQIFGKIEVHTNAFPLSDEKAAVALNNHPVPQVWHLTMDAIKAETFEIIKGIKGFRTSQKQAVKMLRRKGTLKTANPKLALQFIVSDVNHEEAPEFLRFWGSQFDEVGLSWKVTGFHVPHHDEHDYIYFKSLDCPTAEEQDRQNAIYNALMKKLDLVPQVAPEAEEKIQQEVSRSLDTPCSGFWKSPTIGSDGSVTLCTRDNQLQNAIGNIRETSFSSLWLRSPLLNRWRQLVARGDYSELSFCQTCFIPSSVNYTGISAEEIDSFQTAAGLDGPLIEAPVHVAPELISINRQGGGGVYSDRLPILSA